MKEALAKKNFELVEYLLRKGADINGVEAELKAASFEGNSEIVKLLLEKGFDVNA